MLFFLGGGGSCYKYFPLWSIPFEDLTFAWDPPIRRINQTRALKDPSQPSPIKNMYKLERISPLKGWKLEKMKARLSSPQRYTFSRTTCLSKNWKPPTPPRNCAGFFCSTSQVKSQVFRPFQPPRCRKNTKERCWVRFRLRFLAFFSFLRLSWNQGHTPTNVWILRWRTADVGKNK